MALQQDTSYSSNPNNPIYMTKRADFSWRTFIFHVYCPIGASKLTARARFLLPAADWFLFRPWLRGAAATSVEAGRECEDTLGSHRQVPLITIGRAGLRGSKRLLTPMIQVCFPSPHLGPAREALLSWQQFGRRRHAKVTDRQMVTGSNSEYLWALPQRTTLGQRRSRRAPAVEPQLGSGDVSHLNF